MAGVVMGLSAMSACGGAAESESDGSSGVGGSGAGGSGSSGSADKQWSRFANGEPEVLLSLSEDSSIGIQHVVPEPGGSFVLELTDYDVEDDCGPTFIVRYDGAEFTRL